MQVAGSTGFAFNRTRHAYLAKHLMVAATHWTRFRGLMCKDAAEFRSGDGLWIVPCRGVHTWGMNFPIDVIYLDSRSCVVHMEENLKPWRMGRVSLRTRSVIELPVQTVHQSGTAVGDEIEIAIATTRAPEAGGE